MHPDMKVVSTYFDWPGNKHFEKMTKVFIYSALDKKLQPNIIFLPVPKKPKDETINTLSVVANTVKLAYWVRYMREQSMGENILFIDSDTVFMTDPKPVFNDVIDIAYTKRTNRNFNNGGVVFARKSQRTMDFFEKWFRVNCTMLVDNNLRKKYESDRGINQRAFGYMLKERPLPDVSLLELPCAEYNACDEDWQSPNAGAKCVIHYKEGRLRTAITTGKIVKSSNKRRYKRFISRVELWKELYKKAENIKISDFAYKVKTNNKEYLKDEETLCLLNLLEESPKQLGLLFPES